MTGASVTPTALVGPEGLEPHSRLHASHDIASAWTPGPWEPVFGAAHPSVAGLRWVQITPPNDFPLVRDYLSEANARLIALAPELYAELAETLPRNVCLTNTNVPDSTIIPLECTMGDLRRISALLAKVRGVQP